MQWKVAGDLRFRAAISEPETPSFCRISGDLAPSTRKSLAIAIVRFGALRMVLISRTLKGGLCPPPSTWGPPETVVLSCLLCVLYRFVLRVRGRCQVNVCPSIMSVQCKYSRLSDGTTLWGFLKHSCFAVWSSRFWSGWGGGEVFQDFSVPLSPKPTPQSNMGVPWPPSPLLSRLGFRVVWCCPVLFGHTLNQRTLLGICCPLRNRHCLNSCSFGMGGFLFFSPFPSLVSGQAK